MAERVLVVGRGRQVLSRLREALAETGVEAVTTDDADRAERLVAEGGFAVVAAGRGIAPAARARLADAVRARTPPGVYVAGLGPVVPVLVAQIRGALDRTAPAARRLAGVRPERDSVQVDVRLPGPVRVTAYRLGPDHQVVTEQLLDSHLGAGLHDVGLGGIGEEPGEVFVVVGAGEETAAFAVR
jgi:hypothetical protein